MLRIAGRRSPAAASAVGLVARCLTSTPPALTQGLPQNLSQQSSAGVARTLALWWKDASPSARRKFLRRRAHIKGPARKDDVVSYYMIVRDEEGNVLEPLHQETLRIGEKDSYTIPGLGDKFIGKKVGDVFKFISTPEFRNASESLLTEAITAPAEVVKTFKLKEGRVARLPAVFRDEFFENLNLSVEEQIAQGYSDVEIYKLEKLKGKNKGKVGIVMGIRIPAEWEDKTLHCNILLLSNEGFYPDEKDVRDNPELVEQKVNEKR
eukprot:TRINITY_DN4007_c0_g2_i1.p1 TRINITY_DN4007_c0_g2~~TRINITY_DN4007_c0_g2_i1.p1  ORF type:complete len:265 (-),score=52.72 TRINITY_DN4007_c0_g2_i1:41-835(-)